VVRGNWLHNRMTPMIHGRIQTLVPEGLFHRTHLGSRHWKVFGKGLAHSKSPAGDWMSRLSIAIVVSEQTTVAAVVTPKGRLMGLNHWWFDVLFAATTQQHKRHCPYFYLTIFCQWLQRCYQTVSFNIYRKPFFSSSGLSNPGTGRY